MQYRYAQNRNFEDFASGRVFYARPGQAAFPVRLASEIFQRAFAHWQTSRDQICCTVYDPVCGGAYWLAVLAYLHWDAITAIYASDIDTEVLALAERNLSLLTIAGLDRRVSDIEAMIAAYHKESHIGALESAQKFRKRLEINLGSHAIESTVFQANATNAQNMAHGLGQSKVDLVLADVPYGWHSQWRGENDESQIVQTPIWQMLESLRQILKPGAVVAVAADKSQKIKHEKYGRLEHFQVGRRRIFILTLKCRPQNAPGMLIN